MLGLVYLTKQQLCGPRVKSVHFKDIGTRPSIRDGVLHSRMLLYLHHINFKIFFHPAKFDNFKDEKISEFKTVSVSQRKNLLG